MIGSVLKRVVTDWWEDNAPRLGAALAYYTLLSLSPLLVIAWSDVWIGATATAPLSRCEDFPPCVWHGCNLRTPPPFATMCRGQTPVNTLLVPDFTI